MNSIQQYSDATGRPEWAAKLAILPPHMIDGMVRYIVYGISGGSFMNAILSGDLFEALRRADDDNAHAIRSYGIFLFNYAPQGCYGSPRHVSDWIKERGLIGMQQSQNERTE